jgi:hypothetical protein
MRPHRFPRPCALLTITLGLTLGACGAPPSENARSGGQAVTAGDLYNLGTLAHPGSCMDARGGGTTDGTQIQEYACNGSGAQSYELEDAGGGAFFIVNTQANKCVDVQGAGTADGTKIQLYDCNETGAQTFVTQDAGNGLVYFVNTNSNKCLDVEGDNPNDGTVVQLYDCNQTNAQTWNPTAIGAGGGSSSGGSSSSSGGSSSCNPNAWVYMGTNANACAGNLGEPCGWTTDNEGQGYTCQTASWGPDCEPGGTVCPGGGSGASSSGGSSSGSSGGSSGGSSSSSSGGSSGGTCESGHDPLATGNAQQDAYDCMLISFAQMYGDPDPMMAKAQIQTESGFDVLATSPDSPCGDPSGWTDAESKSFGLIQVTPACGEENGALLPNGQPNLDTDMSSSLWATSVYSPTVDLSAGIQAIVGALTDLENAYPGCTAAQYMEMSAGAYNSGESAVSGCAVFNSRAQGYVSSVLSNYQQFAQAAGWPDPY